MYVPNIGCVQMSFFVEKSHEKQLLKPHPSENNKNQCFLFCIVLRRRAGGYRVPEGGPPSRLIQQTLGQIRKVQNKIKNHKNPSHFITYHRN